jgi:cellulose synthase/poly-beta-1,6-N-acetylglucosamine synthase-like glycosyltransferase
MLTDLVLTALAVPPLLAGLYLGLLAVLARRGSAPPASAVEYRFDVIIPAHNEETQIGETIASLKAVTYPRHLYRITVVADNCTDQTAARARTAGADVLVRDDLERRGKGYALARAFERTLAEPFADAVVVVDADTVVSSNLLSAFAARLTRGAQALQADYGVRNPRASWRTRLLTIALSSFHGVRSRARERLGLSAGLRGNGMAFTRQVLQAHQPAAFSIVEDLEYGIHLGLSGIRVQYVEEAVVRGYMAVTEEASRSQRRRWERGRKAVLREYLPLLLRRSARQRDPILADLAVDLLIPPLGQLTLVTLIGLAASLAARSWGVHIAAWLWAAALAGTAVHVLRGWSLSGVGLAGLFDLARAPFYMCWKLTLWFRDKGRTPDQWVRTSREVGS